MTREQFLNQWQVQFLDSPVKIFSASKFSQLVADITEFAGELLVSNFEDTSATIEGKRFGVTIQGDFTGIELSVYGGVLPDGQARVMFKFYKNGTPVITYDNVDGNLNNFGYQLPKFTFTEGISIIDPLDLRFPELDNNTPIVKSKLNKLVTGAFWEDGATIQLDTQAPTSKSTQFFVNDTEIQNAITASGKMSFYYNVNPHFIGQQLEIYFFCPVDSYVSFVGHNSITCDDIFVGEQNFYKYTVNFIPITGSGTDLKVWATLQQCAYVS